MALKMPGTPYASGPVQSLGNLSPGLPVQQASAEAQATLAWGSVFANVGKLYNEISKDLADADQLQRVNTRAMADTNELAALEAFFQYPRITPGADELPQDVPGIIDTYKRENPDEDISQGIPSYKLKNQIWKAATQRMTEASLTGLSSRYAGDYLNKMAPVITNGTRQTAANSVSEYMDDLKSVQYRQINEKINQLDENGARELYELGHASGVLQPEEYNEGIAALGPTIDVVRVEKMLFDANDPADIAEAGAFLEDSRVLPDKRVQLFNALDSATDRQYQLRGRRQKDLYATAQTKLNEGTLTLAWVTQQTRIGNLTGTNAATLRTALTSRERVASNPVITSDFQGAIADLRYLEGDTSVSGKADSLREELRKARYGDNPEISGEDYAKLNAAIDKSETSWAFSNPYYKQTVEQLKTLTGISDLMTSLTGNEPNISAYREGKASLDTYMDMMGGEADPRQWFQENSSLFDKSNYPFETAENVIRAIAPEYLDIRSGGRLDKDMIIADAADRVESGEMERWRLERLVVNLSALPAPKNRADTMENR